MKATSERPRHVVIVGGGQVGCAVAARLPKGWTLVVVDLDPANQASIAAIRPDATFVQGDASSRLTLARCNLEARSVLIAATGSDAVNREAARLAREFFGVEERVVVATRTFSDPADGVSPAEIVLSADAVAGQVVNRVSIEASRAVDIGLGVGEILQVTVLDGSPAVGRALRDFGARHWLVAAVYRAGALLVPHGDTRVEAGDRVLLIGDPSDLQDIAPFFRGGAPVFPWQYGARVAYAGADAIAVWARGFGESVNAEAVVALPPEQQDLGAAAMAHRLSWLDAESIGCVVMGAVRLPLAVRLGLVRSRLHAAIVGSRRPYVLVADPKRQIGRVLVCVRDARAQREVLLAAIDLARLTGASLAALTVEVSGSAPDTLAADIDRAGRIYGLDIAYHRLTGNPVTRIREAAKDFDLVVLGIRPEHNSPLSPDVSTFMLHALPSSAVFVPWSAGG